VTQTATRTKGPAIRPTPVRNGLAEADLKPGDPVPTDRVATAVLINGPLASDWLSRYADPNKRHIRPNKVSDYADKMTDGEWLEMSKTIEFITNGGGSTHLSDGHHRLRAVAQSGCSLWFEVKFGEPPQSRRIEGVRLSRSPGDMLRMEGCPGYYSEIGAGVRNALLYRQTVGTDIRWRASLVSIPDSEDIVLTWMDDPLLWNAVAPACKALVTSWPVGTSQGAMTGFVFLAEKAYPGQGLAFLALIASGAGPRDGRGKSVLGIFLQTARVRPVVKRTKRSGTQLDWNRFSMTVLVRAFNAYVAGKATFQRPEWSDRPFVLEKIR
jgi:hypothetical protein